MSHVTTVKIVGTRLVRTVLACVFALSVSLQVKVVFAARTELVDEPAAFTKCWDYGAAPDLATLAAADVANVYFLDRDRKLQSVDLNTGSKLWGSELGGEVVSNLLVTDSAIFVATAAQQGPEGSRGRTMLRSISKQTGITIWSTDIPVLSGATLGFVSGNIVAISSDGTIVALTHGEGKLAWKKESSYRVTSEPYFGGSYIVFGTDKKEVLKVSASDAQTSVISKTEFLPTAVVLDAQDRLVFGDERGNLLSISADGKRRWKFKNGARISSVLLYDSGYLAASDDNFVYRLSRSGNVEWKRRLSGRVVGKPLIIGSIAVASIVGAGSVYLLNLKSGKIYDRVETGDEVSAGIVARPGHEELVITSSRGLSFFGRSKCATNKKTAPRSVPS